MHPIMMFIGNFGYVAVCVVGAILVMKGMTSFGTIVAFMIYVRLFTNPLSQIAQAMTSLQSMSAAAERVFEFVDEAELSSEKGLTHYVDPKKAKGNIEFKADKSVKFKITDGTKQKYSYTAIDGQTYEYEYYIEEAFIDNYNKYTILKKSGKNYISFGSSSNSYAFEIVSLTKNTFVLRIDDDIFNYDNKSKAAGHVYMTIVSN
jgi:ABC-type multidrug transport system fused ATPase/permease subunit